MNPEDRNIIQRIERLLENLADIKKDKKELVKHINEARLQLSLVEPEITTEIALVELEKIEIDFPAFEHHVKETKAEQAYFFKQLKELKEEFSELKQKEIALECDVEIINTSYK